MINTENLSTYLSDIKKDFYRYRNGVLADSLKKIPGSKKYIFGLTAPQFMELAKKYPKDITLATELWKDKECRESRLLALYLMPNDVIEYNQAKGMILDVDNVEEGDFLAFRVLRYLPYAHKLLEKVEGEYSPNDTIGHCVIMFKKNLDQI